MQVGVVVFSGGWLIATRYAPERLVVQLEALRKVMPLCLRFLFLLCFDSLRSLGHVDRFVDEGAGAHLRLGSLCVDDAVDD